jgi:L-threonylcarbamoyladenylate synthase
VIDPAIRALRQGGVVLYPTMTLWGVGGDARQPGVVARVAALKGRADTHPFLLLVRDAAAAVSLASVVTPAAQALIDALWPGPLTLLLPARADLPAEVVGPTGLVGVRLPQHPVAVDLVAATDAWLVSTSANPTGQPVPTQLDAVDASIREAVDAIAAGPPQPGGQPSTIVAVPADGTVRIVRVGALAVADLSLVVPGILSPVP